MQQVSKRAYARCYSIFFFVLIEILTKSNGDNEVDGCIDDTTVVYVAHRPPSGRGHRASSTIGNPLVLSSLMFNAHRCEIDRLVHQPCHPGTFYLYRVRFSRWWQDSKRRLDAVDPTSVLGSRMDQCTNFSRWSWTHASSILFGSSRRFVVVATGSTCCIYREAAHLTYTLRWYICKSTSESTHESIHLAGGAEGGCTARHRHAHLESYTVTGG